jgi:hypothetical protein
VLHPDDEQRPSEAKNRTIAEEAEDLPPLLKPQGRPEPNIYDQIHRLAQLREERLITPEELEVKKRELLDRI